MPIPEITNTVASLLHRIARSSLPVDDCTLGFERDPDAERKIMQTVREALPEADCSDDEILCLSCFYSKSPNDERLLSPRSVTRAMEQRGYDVTVTQRLITSLRKKGLLEMPRLLSAPEGDETHGVVCAPGCRERLRVAPAVAARFRLSPGSDVRGYKDIRDHLNAWFAVSAMLQRSMKRSGREETDFDKEFEVFSSKPARLKIPDEVRRKKEEIALRESLTAHPLPLVRLVERLRLDDTERDMLVFTLRCTLADDACQVRHLESILRADPFEGSPRRKYLSYAAPLFYYGVLLAGNDAPAAFHPRSDVTVHPALREWLLSGEGDPLRGMDCGVDKEQALPYESNRDHLTDRLRYIGARRRTIVPSRRGRCNDDDGPLFGAAQSDTGLRLRFLEIERHIEARCAASSAKFPLQDITDRFDLTKPERDVLLLLLERELCGLDTEVRDVVAFFGADMFDAARYRRLLQPDASLLRHGLVAIQSFPVFDGADVTLTQDTHEELLAESGGTKKEKGILQLDHRSGFTVETVTQRLDDIVLPPGIENTLRAAIARYESNADALLASWGIGVVGADVQPGRADASLRLLFLGPPGTGKTYTAGALATDLGREMLVTDVSKILSCWVGESEKNVRSMFDEYERLAKRSAKPPVLLLNECDQFLGKRSTRAGRSADRMYHQMQNLFLERIERFSGILVATTNLVDSLDDGFSRRFHYKLQFPMPDAIARQAIWKKHLPPGMPLADDVDVALLARRFAFSGGQIAVAVRNAAIAAAVRGDAVTMADLLEACAKERVGAFGAQHKSDVEIGFRVQA